MRRLHLLLLLLPLAGCTAGIPALIAEAPAVNPSPTQAQLEPARYLGKPVRWGGTIVEVKNGDKDTVVEVVARKIGAGGRPDEGDVSLGRFLARVHGFLEPQIYSRGRLITVYGTLKSFVGGHIGEHPYRYPLVEVREHKLWQPLPERFYQDYDPFYYAPWDPYWRFRPHYPYYPWYPW